MLFKLIAQVFKTDFLVDSGWVIDGACPTNDISIKFEIRPKFAVLWLKIYSIDHIEILLTSRQLYCPHMCKISLWSVKYILK